MNKYAIHTIATAQKCLSRLKKILNYNPGEKSLKAPFAIYLDLECLLKKLQSHGNNSNNNLEESCTQKKAKHEPSHWEMFTRCSFDKKENKLNYHRGNDCIEKLCKKLKECAIKIISFEEKEMIPLTKKEKKSYKKQEKCHMSEEKFRMDKDDENYTNIKKVKDHFHYTRKFRGAAHFKCNLIDKALKNLRIIIDNASYDTHFIINHLAEEFKGELNCIGENMEICIIFTVPIKKEGDNGKKNSI